MNHSFEHEEVVIRTGRRSRLPIIVAVHSRALGPAAGGCRLRRYNSWPDGLTDALRLSKAMTHKAAVAGLDFGGGKSVIALDNDTELTADRRLAALEDLGELVASFEGRYLIGPDIGTGPDDMVVLRRFSPYAFCLPESAGGTGDSGAPTAIGILAAVRAGAQHTFGDSIGWTVMISGFGSVGSAVAAGLRSQGARVLVSDVDPVRRQAATADGYEWIEPDKALSTPTDILIPAAIGGILNAATIPELTARLIVGPANNQLADESCADAIAARGITWIPDYVASAGGIVYTLTREAAGADHDEAVQRVERIGETVHRVLDIATKTGVTPHQAAQQIAIERLGEKSGRCRP